MKLNMRAVISGLLLACLCLLASPALLRAEDEFGAQVRDYLLKNPDIVVEILQNAERYYDARAEAEQTGILERNREALERAELGGFVFGNPRGDVRLVEFFDYQCPHCKAAFNDLIHAVNEDGGVRLILREMPIFGPVSIMAARAALAAQRQRLYFELHAALMANQSGELTEARVFRLAEQAGLDTARLREDMARPEIETALAANLSLAKAIGVRATPSFVDRRRITGQALSRNEFHALFARIREDAN